MMTLDEYESAAARTINPDLDANGRLIDAAAGLSEESGEVLSIIRKHLYQGRALDTAALEKELGDALWCLAMTARAAGLSLESVAAANIRKIEERHPGRVGSP